MNAAVVLVHPHNVWHGGHPGSAWASAMSLLWWGPVGVTSVVSSWLDRREPQD